MCPVHRKEKITEIKERLTKQPDLPTRVISTQLIEAGVDIDFPCVWRSAAGLDSIIQSAGRCNRNGKLQTGIVYVFETSESYGKSKGFLSRTAVFGSEVIKYY
jgi:CRISPR/Cas system-associated endonuclease/helicase Cas3